MIKFFFICLLIANAFLFALWQGYITNPLLETRQPQRLLEQKNSTQLKLISADLATAPPVVPKAIELPKVEPTACLEWGPFQAAELTKVESKLKPLAFGVRQSRQKETESSVTNIIFIPSLGSKEAAEKKAGELVRFGVTDFYIIQDQSPLRWGISLGVFKSEEAARQLLTNLIGKGVRSARLGTRGGAKFTYLFKTVSMTEKTALTNLNANLKVESPGLELRGCK